MRHNRTINHLGRKSGHRKSMLANMACSLILHKRIETTVAKAKALRVYVEPLITKSKDDSTHSRRTVFAYLKQKEAVTELFRNVAPKIADRPGGYTRIIKTGFRQGDAADMAFIELVDFNEAASEQPRPLRRRPLPAAAARKPHPRPRLPQQRRLPKPSNNGCPGSRKPVRITAGRLFPYMFAISAFLCNFAELILKTSKY